MSRDQIELGQGAGRTRFSSLQSQSPSARRPYLPRSCQVNIAWKIGLWDRLRYRLDHFHHLLERQVLMGLGAEGLTALTRANRVSVVGCSLRSTRIARVLTNRPISPSTSLRVRLATGEPITTSS